MKYIKQCNCITRFLEVLAFTLVFLTSNQALAESECIKGHLEAYADFLTPMGPAVGMGIISVDGEVVVVINSFGNFVPPLKITEDGTIHATVLEDDTSPDGSTVQIQDELVLSPLDDPGEFRVLIKSTVLSGTGFFANAYGKYLGHGHMSFNNLRIEHSGSITLCGLSL